MRSGLYTGAVSHWPTSQVESCLVDVCNVCLWFDFRPRRAPDRRPNGGGDGRARALWSWTLLRQYCSHRRGSGTSRRCRPACYVTEFHSRSGSERFLERIYRVFHRCQQRLFGLWGGAAYLLPSSRHPSFHHGESDWISLPSDGERALQDLDAFGH
jgi:hypothetical protein